MKKPHDKYFVDVTKGDPLFKFVAKTDAGPTKGLVTSETSIAEDSRDAGNLRETTHATKGDLEDVKQGTQDSIQRTDSLLLGGFFVLLVALVAIIIEISVSRVENHEPRIVYNVDVVVESSDQKAFFEFLQEADKPKPYIPQIEPQRPSPYSLILKP